YRLVEILRDAGVPNDAIQYLPGPGGEIGRALVEHNGVDNIAFTGSSAVGLNIIEAAAKTRPGQRNVKRVIAEMGGKNAIIIDDGRSYSTVLVQTDISHLNSSESEEASYYVAPTVFTDVPLNSPLAQEEIFGPVLSVFHAADFEEALEIALNSTFALTGGVFSRNPRHIELARATFRTGNLYINRKITGAIVGRQPFGGLAMSGLGEKAGGPDYVRQFMQARVVSENTMRRGFAPEEGA